MQDAVEPTQDRYTVLNSLVYSMMQPDPADLSAFENRVRALIHAMRSKSQEAIPGAPAEITQIRSWLAEHPEAGVFNVFRILRDQIFVGMAKSSVPIVAAVVTTSVIWENGYRLDHVVVPSATREHPQLTLGELSQQLPGVVAQTLNRLGEAGLDEVRQNEAYLMDSVKFEELMGVLDSHIEAKDGDSRQAYEMIVQRMRLLMQVLTEDDLRVS